MAVVEKIKVCIERNRPYPPPHFLTQAFYHTCLTNGAQFILSVFFRLTGCIAYVANIFIFYLTLMLTTVLKTELAELFTLLTAFTL